MLVIEILSTGGTADFLTKKGIPVTQVSVYTDSPEVFNGRVKTLHPKIAGGILGALVIGGVMTHLCCETTARSGFVKGYQIFFPVDTTATYNPNFHTATLRNLSHGFSVITTSEKLIEEMKS